MLQSIYTMSNLVFFSTVGQSYSKAFRLIAFSCINGYLASKIRILVTHQAHLLANLDNIIFLKGVSRLDHSIKNIKKYTKDTA
jgi:hypothetical protein